MASKTVLNLGKPYLWNHLRYRAIILHEKFFNGMYQHIQKMKKIQDGHLPWLPDFVWNDPVPQHYRAPRIPSHRSYYGPTTDPYSDNAYDPRPPRNSYPYNPYRDYHREYPRYPVPPPPQVVYLRDPPDSSRRAKRSEKPGRKIKKDWEIQ